MSATPLEFKTKASGALRDPSLQRALGNMRAGFIAKRRAAAERLPEFEALRDAARDVKDHALRNLDAYLERFEARVTERGGRVHWCPTAEDARETILEICRGAGAGTVVKSKSMVTEEIELNPRLEEAGLEVVETDLGEYIIQLRAEPPSHIIAPAIHLTAAQVERDFRARHTDLPADRRLQEPRDFIQEARGVLRERFRRADVGITGANFLVAETGSVVLVTNEGNADLSRLLPPVHIVVAGIEKVVPTVEDAFTMLRVLARSATGQECSTYTTFATGPADGHDADGRELHVVLLDNGRSGMLGSELQAMLRCIRCGACMNHCPVYAAVGGHAYGSVYSGPMGAVLTPALRGIDESYHLPEASSFCGRCEEVCPVRIPLPALMRHWREREFERHIVPQGLRRGLGAWAFLATRPRLYRFATAVAARVLRRLGGRRRRLRSLPLAGDWTAHRDLPAPEGGTFMQQWREPGAAAGPGGDA